MVAFPIHQVPAFHFTPGHPKPLIALVHHRMVGTLSSTDQTFKSGSRAASTHFGVGLCSKHGGTDQPCIHQYVLLGDQAWGNGNNRFPEGHTKAGQLVRSQWNNRYPTRLVNSRTISIEHHDNGGKPSAVRGIVPEGVLEASLWLDTQLLRGDGAALQALGIRFHAGSRATICRELRAINPGTHSIVDHHYVAGPLKPSCWQPWKKDDTGFPKRRYIDALRAEPRPAVAGDNPGPANLGPNDMDPPDGTHGATSVSDGAEEEVMRSFRLPDVPTLAKVRVNAWLYDNSALEPSVRNIRIDPGREMPLVGLVGDKVRIVSFVDATGNVPGKAYWVAAADVISTRPAP